MNLCLLRVENHNNNQLGINKNSYIHTCIIAYIIAITKNSKEIEIFEAKIPMNKSLN